MASTWERLNDVDLVAVAGITERYKQRPDSARRRYTATVDWLGGYRTEARLGAFQTVRGDEPEQLAGTGTGPAPEEMLLGAVAQCLIVSIAGTMSAREIGIRSLSVDAAGMVNLAVAYGIEEGNPGFHAIELVVHLDADGVREDLQGIVNQALAGAPIPNTVARPVPVSARLA